MKRVLVVGDVIADVYRECVFKKMCPDASAVRAIVETSTDIRPGGAANVAVNLAALTHDVRIDLVGTIDSELARTVKYLSKSRVDMAHCVFSGPIRKERIMLGDEFVVRVDDADLYEFQSQSVQESLEEYFTTTEPDLIVLSDYGSCTVDLSTLPLLLKRRDRLLVDTKIADLAVFGEGGRTLLAKLNEAEWMAALKGHHSPEEFFSYVVVTYGSSGASLIMRSDRDSAGRSICQTITTRGHDVACVDACGCGDTFLAGLAAKLIEGSDPHTAMLFANAAAATVVDQPRTAIAALDRTLGLLGMDK